ncbi:ribonuclease H-like domain-containing protein, partial [Mycena filopes]
MVESFEVLQLGPWSDHAPIVLKLSVPDVPAPTNPGLPYLRDKLRGAENSQEPLDVLLRETMASKKSPEELRAEFYGPVYDQSRNWIEVYTDGSCFENGSPNARAGAGVYYGPNSRYNMSLRVSGDQTNNWGELLAILYVLSTVPGHKSLKIFTDSEYCIRSSVFWAVGYAEKGWRCANADLHQDIISWIRFRSAEVRFVDVKAHSGNARNDGADAAAKAGA